MRRRYTLPSLVWQTPFVAACRFQLYLHARLIVWGRCVHYTKKRCILVEWIVLYKMFNLVFAW